MACTPPRLLPPFLKPNPGSRLLPCHIGVAFYHVPGFATQWVLVLSHDQLFQGKVWCSTAIKSVNGWRESRKICRPSLAAFDPIARLSGVVHVARSQMSMRFLVASVSEYEIVSEAEAEAGQSLASNPDIPERYVVQILLLLYRKRSLKLPVRDPIVLANLIRGGLPVLQSAQHPPMSNTFPVVHLAKCEAFHGRLRF
ncbi:hypothetical protein BC826DRAFT_1108192 [Russula brevipes]|nr:hypothetical protein BC826DRAFT_1108192 [Russula brevipes]